MFVEKLFPTVKGGASQLLKPPLASVGSAASNRSYKQLYCCCFHGDTSFIYSFFFLFVIWIPFQHWCFWPVSHFGFVEVLVRHMHMYVRPCSPGRYCRSAHVTKNQTQTVVVSAVLCYIHTAFSIFVTSGGLFQTVVAGQCGEWGTNSYQSWTFSISAPLLLGSEHQKDSKQRALWNGATLEPLSGWLPCRTDGVCVCVSVCVLRNLLCKIKEREGGGERRQSEGGRDLM